MVAITGIDRNGRTDVSWPDLEDLGKNCTLVEAFIAEHIGGATLAIGERAERAVGSLVSSNNFEANWAFIRSSVAPFHSSEDLGRNAHPVTVISYEMWTRCYKRDPNIVGKTQMLNGVKYTIVGVAPDGFYGTFVGYSWQFWVPASMEEAFEGGGYRLVAGREFTTADNKTTAPVVVVNEAMVTRFWCGENAVGRWLQVKGQGLQVVGVAKTSRFGSLLENSKPSRSLV
jgi:hypothetical protein